MSLNKVFLIGNVGRDPEIRDVNGAKVASFTLACSEKYKDRNGEIKENTDWFNIAAWRSSAEFIEKYVTKGMQVHIEGKIKTRKYTTKEGEERTVTEIVVDHIQPLGKREGTSQSPAPQPTPPPAEPPADSPEDLPF